MKFFFYFKLTFCLVMFFFNISLVASEILIAPSVISVNNVYVGKEFELLLPAATYFLMITNTGNKLMTYKLGVVCCKEYGCSPYFGYTDIKDINWIKYKSFEVIVPARETGYVRDVFIKIPKKKEYYNKKWQAIVKITRLPNPGEGIQLEAVLPLWIETEKKPPSFFEKIFRK